MLANLQSHVSITISIGQTKLNHKLNVEWISQTYFFVN